MTFFYHIMINIQDNNIMNAGLVKSY